MALKLPSSWKVIAFTFNLICGLALSQVLGAVLNKGTYNGIAEVIQGLTMWALSYIMINVGYEFTIDKAALSWYGWDYLIAMTAAGFPWLFVAVWFLATIDGLKVDEAFLVARFAAPTSAGILFSMLEAAGLRETWVFQKARVLAIFDDLDTILLMIPLKVVMIGFKWELLVTIGIMAALLALTWYKLHAFHAPFTWQWTLLYAAIVSAVCKMVHYVTHHHIDMDPVHIEVLLPAFVIGCIIDTPCAREELEAQRQSLSRLQSKISERTNSSKSLGQGSKPSNPSNASEPRIFDKVVPGDLEASWHDNIEPLSTKAFLRQESEPSTCASSPGVNEEELFLEDVDSPRLEPDSPQLKVEHIPNQVPSDGAEHVGAVRAPAAKAQHKARHSADSEESAQIPVVSAPSSQPDGRLVLDGLKKEEEHHHESEMEHTVNTTVSMVFMVLVGLSMPPLIGKNADDSNSGMAGGLIACHVAVVTVLMILGKMFPSVCYREEASRKACFALCLGMCPRGEVGASIIVISLDLGISGPSIIISMCALVINLVMSGGFIGAVKVLLRGADVNSDNHIDKEEWAAFEKENKQ